MRQRFAMFGPVVLLAACSLAGCSGSSQHPDTLNPDASADEMGDTPTPRSKDTGSSDSGSTSVPEALPGAKSVACHVDESIPVTVAPEPPKPQKGAPKGTPAGDPNPPMVQQISISPKELMWRIDEKRVGDIYAKVIDNDFKPKYAKVQPGPDTMALDAEVQQQKDVFRRSLLEFGAVPTGIDASALKGEYTYNNGETMMRITRKGKTRDFFFIQHKLWKIVDELPLGPDAEWGENFAAVVVKISGSYGVPGRICEPDYERNRPRREVDWRDGNTQVRAIEWDDKTFALVFVDLGTVGQLASWRSNKASQTNGIDPSVQDVMHTPQQPPPKEKKDEKKK